jgi:hypothetical protein
MPLEEYLPAGGFMTWNRLGKPVACIKGKHLTSRETFRLLDRKIRNRRNGMPLTKKGTKVLSAMRKEYGAKKGTRVFYASVNKGTVKGAERRSGGGRKR